MTDLIATLDALAEKATARPWSQHESGWSDYILGCPTPEVNPAVVSMNVGTSDAAFIVALVNAYPALRAELLAARELIPRIMDFTDFGPGEDAEIDALVDAWRAARGNNGGGT